jgi:hypothetical protein
MSTTTHSWQGGSADPAAQLPGFGAGGGGSSDASLIGATSDTCSHCGAGLAPDQRYCVECGERRGKPRFTPAAVAATTSEAPKRPPRRPRRMNASAGTTLIAGVATLLLALGVGVLIGQSNAPAPSSSKQIVVSVPSSAPAAVGAATTAQTTTAASSAPVGASSKGSKGAKAAKSSTTTAAKAAPVSAAKATSAAAQQAAANQAAKTLGNSNIGNPTATVGSTCNAGTPGCENGKQTQQLFGGG